MMSRDLVTTVLEIVGAICLIVAATLVDPVAGWTVAGVALILFGIAGGRTT